MKTVELYLELIHQTEKAYLVSDGDNNIWLPKSQVEYDGEEFSIPEWLAIDKGLV
jgi:hypothetical protein